MLYVAPPHAIHLARRDTVERNGDRSYIVAREHQRKEPSEVFGGGLRIAEDGRALLKRRDRYIPKPGAFACLGGAAFALELIGSCLQFLRKAELVKKRGERLRLLRRGRCVVCALGKAHERCSRRLAQKIYVLERTR